MKKITLINSINNITVKLDQKENLLTTYNLIKNQQGQLVAMPINDYMDWFNNHEPENYEKIREVVDMFSKAMEYCITSRRSKCTQQLRRINVLIKSF